MTYDIYAFCLDLASEHFQSAHVCLMWCPTRTYPLTGMSNYEWLVLLQFMGANTLLKFLPISGQKRLWPFQNCQAFLRLASWNIRVGRILGDVEEKVDLSSYVFRRLMAQHGHLKSLSRLWVSNLCETVDVHMKSRIRGHHLSSDSRPRIVTAHLEIRHNLQAIQEEVYTVPQL